MVDHFLSSEHCLDLRSPLPWVLPSPRLLPNPEISVDDAIRQDLTEYEQPVILIVSEDREYVPVAVHNALVLVAIEVVIVC